MLPKASSSKGFRRFFGKNCLTRLPYGFRSDPRVISNNVYYRLSNGKIVTRAQAVTMVKKGELPGYNIIKVNGVEYLRDNPDSKESDNIDNQPLI